MPLVKIADDIREELYEHYIDGVKLSELAERYKITLRHTRRIIADMEELADQKTIEFLKECGISWNPKRQPNILELRQWLNEVYAQNVKFESGSGFNNATERRRLFQNMPDNELLKRENWESAIIDGFMAFHKDVKKYKDDDII